MQSPPDSVCIPGSIHSRRNLAASCQFHGSFSTCSAVLLNLGMTVCQVLKWKLACEGAHLPTLLIPRNSLIILSVNPIFGRRFRVSGDRRTAKSDGMQMSGACERLDDVVHSFKRRMQSSSRCS